MKHKMRNKIYIKIQNNLRTLFILILLSFIIIIPIITTSSYATSNDLDIISEAAILIDNTTNKILYSKNANKRMYPASTTKILTSILVLENSNLNEFLTVSYDSIMSIPNGYSTASLQIGEQLTIEQLLELLLVRSANDAANVLAEHVGGSIESFVSMMNTKANEIGLVNSHFTNAYGLHDNNHYTTASDLAILMKYCIKNDTFRKISGSASCAIPATNKYEARLYTSTNDLIIPNNKIYYPYITAGKTGFTTQAGDCLVSCSYKDNLELICVILGGKTINDTSSRFSDTKKLYEFGYENYSIKTLVNKNDVLNQIEVENATNDTKALDLLSDNTINALIKNGNDNNIKPEIILTEKIKAPIKEGEILGTAKFQADNTEYIVNLVASHDVEKSKLFEYILQTAIAIFTLLLIYRIFYVRHKHK